MINIVVYARYSSNAQTEQSIEGQLRVCREYAKNKGYSILHEYIDRAMTGTNDNRPEFQQMIKDSEKKTFQYVLVYKLDRFSRNKYDNALYKHKLQQNGVKVISATEAISDTPEGALMEGLLEMFAELYSKDLSQKVTRGLRESILKGNFVGGNILYGYQVKDKKIIINEEQAPAVKFIFEEYAKGTRKTEIVEQLNKMGYRTNKGKKFTKQSIQNSLSNKKYIGLYKNDFVENNNYYPAIIDKAIFDKVQERLKLNKRFATMPKEKFLLSGKVFCGHCGANMIGTSGTSHTGKTHAYYTCLERNKRHNCDKSNENKQKLEDFVFNKIYTKILQPNKIEEIADKLLQEYENDINNTTLKQYERKIEEIEKQFDKITQQIIKSTNDNIIERLNKQANDLTEQQNIYKEQIKKLKLAMSIKHSKEDIVKYLKFFLNDNPKEESFKEKLFDLFVNSVYVFDDYINIYIDMFDMNDKITFEEAKEHTKQAEQRFAHLTECSTKKKTISVFFYCRRLYKDCQIFALAPHGEPRTSPGRKLPT